MQIADGEGFHGCECHLDVFLYGLVQSNRPEFAEPPAVLVDLPEDKKLVIVKRVEASCFSVWVLR